MSLVRHRSAWHKAGLVALVVVVVSALVGLEQFGEFRSEKADLDETRVELSIVVKNAKTTAARLPEFRREVERKLEAIAALRRILPSELDVPEFMASFEALAEARSVGVVHSDVTTNRFDFYNEAVITMLLDGDERAIEELGAALASGNRMVRWWTVPGDTSANFGSTIYASPVPPERADRALCPPEDGADSGVCVAPLAEPLAAERARQVELCHELTRLEPIADMISDYQRLLGELEELERLIEGLRAPR